MQRAAAGQQTRRWLVSLLAVAGWLLRPLAAGAAPAPLLDVPFISQDEQLCGGAAAAMVLRYWGARGIDAASFAPLVDRSAAGIRTTALVDDLRHRGWMVTPATGSSDLLATEIAAGRPVLALIEERPHTFHYVVIVGLHERAIVFHDPARAPFRVMRRDEFDRRWQASDRWMALVLPAAAVPASSAPPVAPLASTPPASGPTPERAAAAGTSAATSCDALVADGVTRAQANDLPGAERVLTTALSCPGAAALRELAGVRALQRRWADVSELARAALSEEPHDAYTWQLLGTSEFVQDQPLAALDAWNEAGQPRVDLVRVDGLERTRHRVVERLIGVDTRTILTRNALIRARRQLAELPSAGATRLTYSPVAGGLVELRATVVERPLLPRDPWSLAAIGVTAASGRSVSATVGSLTGGGETTTLSWRFWPHRPRIAVALEAPAPFAAATWGVSAFAEEQPFDEPAMPTTSRRSVRVVAAKWVGPVTRVSLRGGVDRWRGGDGLLGSSGLGVRFASPGDRLDAQADIDLWSGAQTFAALGATLRARSSTARRGIVLTGTAGAAAVGRTAPGDLWPAGDTGWARPILLRAHPLVTDGAFRVTQLGRDVVHASFEAQRWWAHDWSLLHIGMAAFVDTARTMNRLNRPARGDADVGLGVRFAVLSLPGVLRIDAAHGLRDGARALSLLYVLD